MKQDDKHCDVTIVVALATCIVNSFHGHEVMNSRMTVHCDEDKCIQDYYL